MSESKIRRAVIKAVVIGIACIAIIASGCSGNNAHDAKARPDVVIITMDTTRADHLGCYGSPTVKTPDLDAFSSGAATFVDCYCAANVTNPSHTSIFTSLYMRDHGVLDNRHRLPEYPGFMPRLFRSAGYRTAAFTSGGHLNTVSNFNQGFDEFSCPEQYTERSAGATTDKVIEWLDKYTSSSEEAGHKPFMLWVHYFDPHMKYNPPAPYDTMYRFKSGERLDWDRLFDLSEEYNRKYLGASKDPEHFRNLYKGEVSYMDSQIGRLLDRLKQTGLFGKSIIVIVADHGESLGEHGIFWDHAGLYDVTMRVPLMIKPSGEFTPGVRDQLVSTLDIYPTVLELAGIKARTPVMGRSLVGVLGNPSYPDPRKEVYFQSVNGKYLGIRTHDYTYIMRVKGVKGAKAVRGGSGGQEPDQLYDDANDRAQTKNLVLVRPEVSGYFREKGTAFMDEKPLDISSEKITDKAYLDKLKALGYVQ